MYKICGTDDSVRDLRTVIRLLKNNGIKSFEPNTECQLCFPDFSPEQFKSMDSDNFKVHEIKTEGFDFSIDHVKLTSEYLPSMMLDHREMGYLLDSFMEQLNMILSISDLKLVKLDTLSDYMSAFITSISTETDEEMINSALKMNGFEDVSFIDFYSKENGSDEDNNEYTIEDALNLIINNTKIDDEKINKELLIEFIEDLAPEQSYEVVNREGKSFLKIENFK